MSKHESDDLGVPGYFLPEDSQFRLAKLSDYIKFLSRLARPRMADEAREWAPPLGVGELAICLELLAEQTDLVLEAVSWPAQREVAAEAPERDAVPTATPEAPDTAAERFAFGVTLDQIDTLDRLIQTISAHGDVVAASHAAELAHHTLPLLGHAIHDGAAAVRALLDEVEAQRLGQGPRPRSGVGEERGVYGAGLACATVDGPPGPVVPLPAVPSLEYARPPRSLRLH
ncbi:XAC0095 family protein [Luteimonas salinilitoris]|uniref:XAC0095 family protein n=1 Tax=Luteimonas salinilitoris TaxID=3237697 RepID=A0ABV4HVP3_9GAMM